MNRRKSLRLILLLVTGVLVWWALRQISFADIWRTLATVHPLWIALLLAVNAGVIWLFGSRWWLILRALNHRPPYRSLIAYRLTAFGISYFTPGTQFGGEPAQIYLLSRRNGISTGDAVLSVALDKLFELAFNFSFLGLGIFITLRIGIFPTEISPALSIAAIGLAVLPLLLPILLCRRKPLRISLPFWMTKRPIAQKITGHLRAAVETGAGMCRQSPRRMFGAVGLSVLIWAALVAEYWLMVRALGLSLSPAETVVLLTAARLAFLFPTPGGLGALEAGQVIAMDSLGFDPAVGLSLSLLIRARDILFGLAGLWLGHRLR